MVGSCVAPNARVKLDDEEWQAAAPRTRAELGSTSLRLRSPRPHEGSERDESAQNEMAGALEFLRILRDETGAAVLFVHHTGHQGDHMRGSSDLETVWETRLRWKRDGQSPEVTVESEHRETDAAAPFKYRISWDGLTRSMRFDAVEDPFVKFVTEYAIANPTASANDVYKATEGRTGSTRHRRSF